MTRTLTALGLAVALFAPAGAHAQSRPVQKLQLEQFFDMESVSNPKISPDGTLGPEPELSPPRLVFDKQYRFGPNLSIPHYSMNPDGERFLFVQEEPGARSLDFVTHWLTTLDRR